MKVVPSQSISTREYSILKFSILSRVITLVLAFLADALFPQAEFGDHVFFMKDGQHQYSLISYLFKCVVRWDADYFFAIATRGYLKHREHCFFSLFPYSARGMSYIFRPIMSMEDAVLLSGVIINFIAFQVATLYIYRLSKIILKDEELAYKVALLFCFNPGSMHFTAFYCDCLFTAFFVMGLYYLYASNNYLDQMPIIKASICFFFASWTRANGTFNLFFVAYRFLHIFVKILVDNQYKIVPFIKQVVGYVPIGIFSVICLSLPFVLHMAYLYSIYCVDVPSQLTDYVKPEYCVKGFWTGYAYMQTHFFGVTPFIWNNMYNFFANYRVTPIIVFYAAFVIKIMTSQSYDVFLLGIPSAIDDKAVESPGPKNDYMKSPMLVPFFWVSLVNWNAMMFNSHIVVSTRIFCQNPIVYWYAVYILAKGKPAEKGTLPEFSIYKHWVIVYFLVRFITGPIVYGGDSPWF